MYIYEKAFQIAEKVVKEIDGRAADGGINLPWLISMAISAGPGDHCEVGSLFGASAIAVAVAKKEWGFPGLVYCVDPYEPREQQNVDYKGPPALFNGSPEILAKNAAHFGVADRIMLVQSKSQPWPEPLVNQRFVSSFIDGDHQGQAPWWDFIELERRTDHYIGIDNFEENYPDVVNATLRALNGRDWFLFFKNATFIALRKTMLRPDRSVLDLNRL